ncbi:hypothetical protein ODZ84_18985 [Chryseobacterium fluminis]|uniref:hypothetical protein n=1 Tax=Chryseobacterium fluminis TaxID=2983606 RepID=UPI00225A7ED6|nr:hypothetical protein [Chryseobacterium sp. MMS21-Ot14]UZT97252.1 hypothetical protein ODZ84_18985 [Chryseobacterium sp. MMS21-Ot14]
MNRFFPIELNNKELSKQTLQYIYSIENSYVEYTLYLNILNPLEKYGDLRKHESFLKERLSKLEFSIDYDEVTFENNISGYLDNNYELLRKLSDKKFELEKLSKEIFWSNNTEKNIYQSISDFNCFEDKFIPADKINKKVINIPFNIDGWGLYYQKLLQIKFPEFSEVIVVDKEIIQYRHLKEDFYLGIKINYQTLKSNLKKNFDAEPNHKLVIFKKIDKKKIDHVVTFDKFVHPHFNPPAYSFGWYYYAENSYYVNNNEMRLNYIIEKDFLENGNVRLFMSEEFGKKLKKHAYFYYHMLHETTKEYIKFIEESFIL